MDFHAFSGLLNGVAATVSGLLVYLKHPANPKHQAYGFYALAAAIWGFGYCAWQLSTSHDDAIFFARLLMVGAIFLPLTYLWHVFTLLEQVAENRRFLWLMGAVALVFFGLNFTPHFVADVKPIGGFPFWPQPGLAFHFYLPWFGLATLYGTGLLIREAWTKSGTDRDRFYLLSLGSIIAYIGGMTAFPLWYGIHIPPIGTIFLTVYTATVAYTLLRYRLLDLGTAFERGVTGTLLIILIAFPAYPILLLAQQWLLGTINIPYSLIELAVLITLVFGASSLKTQAKALISKALFKERYDQYETVLEFSKSLVSILELQDLTSTIVKSICPQLGIQWGILYLRDSGEKDFHPVSSFGKPVTDLTKIHLGSAPTLRDTWRQHPHCYTSGELQELVPSEDKVPTLEVLSNMGMQVCVPLVNKNRLLGFCAFGPNTMSGGGYTTQDLELLTTLFQEASVALDNALLYEDLKRSQSLVRRTDRLRSLETMAGGMAHEIRNPLTSIKAFVDLAPERKDDEQFLARFSKVVKEDVFRIERLTREILDFAKPMEPFLKGEDMNEIVESCLYTLRLKSSPAMIVFKTDLVHDLPKIFADRQQLKQVLLNLLFNALDSMLPEGGVLSVKTRCLPNEGKKPFVQVEIRDTGTGIASEDVEHIFDPFFTTKHLSQEHEGTGLGLAIAHQIIQEHQGTIEVVSAPGLGTTFLVNLPSYQSPAPSLATASSQQPTS